jgi:hypothetical protein
MSAPAAPSFVSLSRMSAVDVRSELEDFRRRHREFEDLADRYCPPTLPRKLLSTFVELWFDLDWPRATSSRCRSTLERQRGGVLKACATLRDAQFRGQPAIRAAEIALDKAIVPAVQRWVREVANTGFFNENELSWASAALDVASTTIWDVGFREPDRRTIFDAYAQRLEELKNRVQELDDAADRVSEERVVALRATPPAVDSAQPSSPADVGGGEHGSSFGGPATRPATTAGGSPSEEVEIEPASEMPSVAALDPDSSEDVVMLDTAPIVQPQASSRNAEPSEEVMEGDRLIAVTPVSTHSTCPSNTF